jgi:hypothetical protein
MRRIAGLKPWLLCMLTVLAGTSIARAAGHERSIRVSGDLVIATDGSVRDVELAENTAPGVANLVKTAVQRWRFAPVVRNGAPITAKTGMQLALAAIPVGDGFKLRVEKVMFLNARAKPLTFVVPQMPREAMMRENDIEVLAALRVDADGTVVDAAVLSVKFSKIDNPRLRREVARDVPFALKRSTFRPAEITAGENGDDTFFVPIDYRSRKRPEDAQMHSTALADRFGDALPVPWLTKDQQPRLIDLPNVQGQPVGLAGDIRLAESIVGTTL